MENIISFTDAAVAHIKQTMAQEKDAIGFRFSLKKRGCTGYAYVPEIVKSPQESDLHLIVQDQLSIYIDPQCEKFIKGMVVDYIEDTKLGIRQKRLIFNNPNEKDRCGCGESFTVE